MDMEWNKKIPESEITGGITCTAVDFAKEFGQYLARDSYITVNGRPVKLSYLSTSQLRKFFGEIKRQQLTGYNEADFILLKPKLAYAVGRAEKNSKVKYFYEVISDAIDKVKNEQSFKNFIKIFEAIVAYHKEAEPKKN